MKINWKERAEQLVDDHWDYHDVIIPIFMEADQQKFFQAKRDWGEWYKQIGIHFYKHAIEDMLSERIHIEKEEIIRAGRASPR